MRNLIIAARQARASDLHLVCGRPPMLRLDGELVPLQGAGPLSADDCLRYGMELLGTELPPYGEVDFARTVEGVRLRVNLFYASGTLSAAIRLLSDHIPVLDELGLPPVVSDFPNYNRGIVLVTGETGSGKSTTLAAILNQINQSRRAHIITLEDPIEYQYHPVLCVINQREIGRDTESYANGLRAALREDPDIILIGEMRDEETIETALTAAETGHLVFATLHTNSAPDCVDRIVSVFPAGRQGQIRMQLSMTLRAVLAQQLLPRIGGGRIAACEVMVVNNAAKNLIREGKTPQLVSTVQTSAKDGSITMDNALLRLYRGRLITKETAVAAAADPEYVKRG